ncbi:MAG: hypothetical protein L3J66_04525 [Bacteroidales bacterium]|nr:hypothetical protein [Bacteroidales bacterium]
MAQKEIKLLEQQISRLSNTGFDLEAWKKYTIIVLARIFGSNDEKIRQVEQLESEFSSWSLRDASGNKSYEERTKKLAKEILTAAIDEIKVFGISEDSPDNQDKNLEDILNIILDELKGSQVKQLKTILSSRRSKAEKSRKIKELLEGIGEYGAYAILTNMLMHPEMGKLTEKA